MGDLKLKPARLLNRAELEEYASWLASRIARLTEERLNLPADEVAVRVDISDEWPYTVEVEVFVMSRLKSKGLEHALNEILDQAIAELAEKVAGEGFRLSK